jgi:hypothetical protein
MTLQYCRCGLSIVKKPQGVDISKYPCKSMDKSQDSESSGTFSFNMTIPIESMRENYTPFTVNLCLRTVIAITYSHV